ncbi:MAG: hypothetical protein MZV70_33925 [Desulfobacterales bacterium]|nr:hypothetical protein [Desulfobacterales bacterium]
MLFVEGNHFCPSCEKSGDCRLQALGLRSRGDDAALPALLPGPSRRRLAPRDPARLQPLHPLRAVRARRARGGRQARLRAGRPRHRQAPDRQRASRAGSPTPTSRSPTRRSRSARSA